MENKSLKLISLEQMGFFLHILYGINIDRCYTFINIFTYSLNFCFTLTHNRKQLLSYEKCCRVY